MAAVLVAFVVASHRVQHLNCDENEGGGRRALLTRLSASISHVSRGFADGLGITHGVDGFPALPPTCERDGTGSQCWAFPSPPRFMAIVAASFRGAAKA